MNQRTPLSFLYDIPQIKLTFTNPTRFNERIFIGNIEDAYNVFYNLWDKSTLELFEEVKVLYLNTANHVIGAYSVNKGSTNHTIVDTNRIIAAGLLSNCSGLCIAHSHPSNNPIPSDADRKITETLQKACSFFNIVLIDHLIICPEENKYTSIMHGK